MNNMNYHLLNRRNVVFGGATLAATSALACGAARGQTSSLNPPPLPPSPDWAVAMPVGPDTRVKITETYARLVARDVYFWAWPMVNVYSRRLAFRNLPDDQLKGAIPNRSTASADTCF